MLFRSFGKTVSYNDEAITHLKQPGIVEILQAFVNAIDSQRQLTLTEAKQIVEQVTKSQGVKKGLVMRSLRAGLMGELQGPDLLQSWVLLHQKGWDKSRLEQALDLAIVLLD